MILFGENQLKLPETLEDLQYFIKNQIQESLHLDYKRSAALSKKKINDFIKDVTSFANSDGGILIYGVVSDEDDRYPLKLDGGIENDQITSEQIENWIISNITPRLSNFKIIPIPAKDNSRTYYSVAIGKTRNRAHQNTRDRKYYKRFNFQNEPMYDYEIQDVNNRTRQAKRLINIKLKINDGTFYLVIENPTDEPAKMVSIRLSEGASLNFNLREGETIPLLYDQVETFASNSEVSIYLGQGHKLFSERSNIPVIFSVTAKYQVPSLNEIITEVFDFDLNIYKYGEKETNHARALEQNLTREIKNLNQMLRSELRELNQIANPSGLHLSHRTLVHLSLLLKNNDVPKIKIDLCTASQICEILDITFSEARKIHSNALSRILTLDDVPEHVRSDFEDYFLYEHVMKS